MTIRSNAAPDEMNSPFYKENERICDQWDKLIERLGGKCNAEFNSWSYKIIGISKTNVEWRLEISRSTYSSTGIASFNNWNVFEGVSLNCRMNHSKVKEFSVRKNSFLDFFRNTKPVKFNHRYVLLGDDLIFTTSLIEPLKEPLIRNKLVNMTLKDGHFELRIHAFNECYQVIQNLIENLNNTEHNNGYYT